MAAGVMRLEVACGEPDDVGDENIAFPDTPKKLSQAA
jgi:hypothetical protein